MSEQELFSKCPESSCQAVFRCRKEILTAAMGMVRCPHCKTVFNALNNLVEASANQPFEDVRNQLPYKALGDRVVADRATLDKLRSTLGGPEAPHAGDGLDEEETDAGTAPRPYDTGGEGYALPPKTELAVAARNLVRNRKRTFMSLLAICFGVIALILASGFIESMNYVLREGRIESQLGHIQIVRPDFFEKGEADPFAYLLPETSEILDHLESREDVEAVSPRLGFSGLVSFGDTSVSFLGDGVVPEREAAVSKQLDFVEGEPLDPARTDQVIVGVGLAASLGVEPGDRLILLTKTESGSLNAAEAEVSGLFRTPIKAYDDAYLRTSLSLANQLTRTTGAHKWVVLLDETEKTRRVVADLQARFGAGAGVEFVPWRDLADFYNKTVTLFNAQVNVVRLVIALIIVASITNTLTMSVIERTSEIGTLMATGFRRAEVLSMFVKEGVVLGVLGGIVGLVIGLALSVVITRIGIPMPPPPGMGFGFTGFILVTPFIAVSAVVIGIAATVLASIYPARKASRLSIVDALRHAK